jgi:ribonuclease E
MALAVLRLIGEDVRKDRTGRVIVQLPVDVATYLINEKREALRALEDKSSCQLVIVPNPHIQTPEYSIRRVRDDEVQLPENAQISYQIPVAPAAADPAAERDKRPPAEQPAVAALLPKTAAPIVAAPATAAPIAAAVAPSQPAGGFWDRVKRLFVNGNGAEAPAGTASAAEAHAGDSPAEPRGREHGSGGGRREGSRGRDRRPHSRGDGSRRDEPRRDGRSRDEAQRGREGPRRDPRRDEPRRDEPRRDEPRRTEPRRETAESALPNGNVAGPEQNEGIGSGAHSDLPQGERSERRSRRGGRRRRRGGGGGGGNREQSTDASGIGGDVGAGMGGGDPEHFQPAGQQASMEYSWGSDAGVEAARPADRPHASSAPPAERPASASAPEAHSAGESRPYVVWSSAPPTAAPAPLEERREE